MDDSTMCFHCIGPCTIICLSPKDAIQSSSRDVCMCVCVFVCMFPLHPNYFTASHWPTPITLSLLKPLTGLPPPPTRQNLTELAPANNLSVLLSASVQRFSVYRVHLLFNHVDGKNLWEHSVSKLIIVWFN